MFTDPVGFSVDLYVNGEDFKTMSFYSSFALLTQSWWSDFSNEYYETFDKRFSYSDYHSIVVYFQYRGNSYQLLIY